MKTSPSQPASNKDKKKEEERKDLTWHAADDDILN